MKFWLRPTNHQAWRILGAGFRRAGRFGADKILAILCRANSPNVTKDLCKVPLVLKPQATATSNIRASGARNMALTALTSSPLGRMKGVGGTCQTRKKRPNESRRQTEKCHSCCSWKRCRSLCLLSEGGEFPRFPPPRRDELLTERDLLPFKDFTVNIRPKFLECLTHNVQADV